MEVHFILNEITYRISAKYCHIYKSMNFVCTIVAFWTRKIVSHLKTRQMIQETIFHLVLSLENLRKNDDTVCLFGLILKHPSQQLSHARTVTSPNYTFSWASLTKRLTSTSCTHSFACNSQKKTFLNQRKGGEWPEENDRRNYFMINLHESMGPGYNRTRGPLICSLTCIWNHLIPLYISKIIWKHFTLIIPAYSFFQPN